MFLSDKDKKYNQCIATARRYMREGNLADALKIVRQAMELKPSSNEAYSLYIDICCQDKKHPFMRIAVAIHLVFLGHYFGLGEESLAKDIWVQEAFKICPDGTIETSDAVCLELSSDPRTLLQVTATPGQYTLRIVRRFPIAGVEQETWKILIESIVLPDLGLLPDTLRQLISRGLFEKVGNELIFRG